jgi:hypothetical protein
MPDNRGEPDFSNSVTYRERLWSKLGHIEGQIEALVRNCAHRKAECEQKFARLSEEGRREHNCVLAMQVERKTQERMVVAAARFFAKRILPPILYVLAGALGIRELDRASARPAPVHQQAAPATSSPASK